jgi:hypothetical protein
VRFWSFRLARPRKLSPCCKARLQALRRGVIDEARQSIVGLTSSETVWLTDIPLLAGANLRSDVSGVAGGDRRAVGARKPETKTFVLGMAAKGSGWGFQNMRRWYLP